MAWYNFSSASTLLTVDNVVLSVEFIFSLSSAVKSSSNGDHGSFAGSWLQREYSSITYNNKRILKKQYRPAAAYDVILFFFFFSDHSV
ncbi:hypothetical protein QQF64_003258 [Cirrhinus molitorella]|uniref:Secreted protein n=1 Tax=Cirrhinus molitorella TaxID=172907 RepID=A0ABR3MKK9_9TELE